MKHLKTERLDHFGIIAGVAKDLEIKEMIDEMIAEEDVSGEKITSGEAALGMALNGMSFLGQPMYFTPAFFEKKPMELLFREGVIAEHFNRHKLGRVLDKVADFGCDAFFSRIAARVIKKEGVSTQFYHLDTTSFSFHGDYDKEDMGKVEINRGHSKDHRPDLKQLVQELIVTQDGGIPILCKTFSGNSSDSVIMQDRVRKLVKQFCMSQAQKIVVGDSKLLSKNSAPDLAKILFITRMTSTLTLEKELIQRALKQDSWINHNNEKGYTTTSYNEQVHEIPTRCVVVKSEAARKRAEQSIKRKVSAENKLAISLGYHLKAKNFSCEADAMAESEKIQKRLKYHIVSNIKTEEVKTYKGKGRPKKDDPFSIEYKVIIDFKPNDNERLNSINEDSCFVLVTNVDNKTLDDYAVLEAYKKQSLVENSFSYLKDHQFFASAIFLKNPKRIQALLAIMVLALLLYSVAQRRLRSVLEKNNETLPNQIDQPTKRPTMKWVFQKFHSIDIVWYSISGKIECIIDGLNEFSKKVISLLGGYVQKIYQFSGVIG